LQQQQQQWQEQGGGVEGAAPLASQQHEAPGSAPGARDGGDAAAPADGVPDGVAEAAAGDPAHLPAGARGGSPDPAHLSNSHAAAWAAHHPSASPAAPHVPPPPPRGDDDDEWQLVADGAGAAALQGAPLLAGAAGRPPYSRDREGFRNILMTAMMSVPWPLPAAHPPDCRYATLLQIRCGAAPGRPASLPHVLGVFGVQRGRDGGWSGATLAWHASCRSGSAARRHSAPSRACMPIVFLASLLPVRFDS
jgi:hypothetical protein